MMDLKKILRISGVFVLGYYIWRVITKDVKPNKLIKEAIKDPLEVVAEPFVKTAKVVKDVIKKPIKTAEKVVKAPINVVKKVASPKKKRCKPKCNKLVKGSAEAKAWAKKMQEARKKKAHKGHKSKRGLALDQKKVSKEKHEQAYQKKKED
jgi:hypothetical protein